MCKGRTASRFKHATNKLVAAHQGAEGAEGAGSRESTFFARNPKTTDTQSTKNHGECQGEWGRVAVHPFPAQGP